MRRLIWGAFFATGLLFAQPQIPFNSATCDATSGTTCVITLSTAPAANDTGVILLGGSTAGLVVSSVTGGGFTWSPTASASLIRNTTQKEVEAVCGNLATGSGGTTITITMSGTITTLVSAVFAEVAGASCNSDGGGAIGFAAAHGTTGAPSTSGDIGTTKENSEIAFSAAMVDTAAGFTSMTGGYTALASLDAVFIPGYLLTSAIGTATTSTWTGISSASWGAAVVVLRSPGGATYR